MAKDGDDDKASGSTPSVFISYASLDSAIAETVCEALEKAGVPCWIAPRDVTPGAFYGDEIVHAIDAAKAIALILSQNAATSPHVLREVERAASKRHAVISLRIDKTPLPAGLEYFLNTSQWLDASSGDTVRALPKLVSAVQVAIQAPTVTPTGIPTPHTPAPAVSARSGKRMALVIASVVSLALVGFAADRLWLSSHRAAATPATTPPAAILAVPTIPEKSVAVLPFVDMSEKKDQEYFSDGLSEELIDMLSRVPDLRVPARTSSFYFKGKQTTMAEIAKALSVSHVLEGSVRKSANKLRVTAQLIRVDNGYHVWSDTYDRKLDDVFKVQDEIASAVVKALKLSLFNEPIRRVTSSNPEAYSLYLRGRTIIEGGTTAADAETGLRYLERSAQIDPGFAPVWATISRARLSTYMDFGVGSFDVVRREVLDAAQKAVAIDPSLAEAHVSLARAMSDLDWQWGDADREMRRALELEPRNAHVLRNAFYLSLRRGRWEEAFGRAKAAVEFDSLNYLNFERLGDAEFYRQRYAEAEIHYREALELSPAAAYVRSSLADVLLRQGRLNDVLSEAEKEPLEPARRIYLPYFLNAMGRSSDAAKALADAESRYGGQFPYYIGNVCAAFGNFDRAFYWWERALREHDPGIVNLLSAPIDTRQPTLAADPRYSVLLHKINLVQ